MKLKLYGLVSLSFLTVLAFGHQGSSKTVTVEAVSMAKITRMSGKVLFLNQKKWVPAKKFQIIKMNESLKTAVSSRAELTFSNGTRIRMAENTSIILIKSKKSKKNSFLKVMGGKLWASIFNNGKSKFAIEGTTATLAVLGTTFEVEAQKTKTDVSIFDGSVGIQLSTNNIESLNNNLDNLKLKNDSKSGDPGTITKPGEINKPVHQIEKPVKMVPGPYQVSKDEWLEVVENQKISIDDKGIGTVSDLEPAKVKDDEWIKWNQQLDTSTAENILFDN